MSMFGFWASGLLAALFGGAVLGAVAARHYFAPRALYDESEVYEVFLAIAAALGFICAWLGGRVEG
jgi:hypothetical protein